MTDVDQDFETVLQALGELSTYGGHAAHNPLDMPAVAALSRIREEWEDTADSNRVWQEVAQEVCAATGATALVHVPAIFDALRAEVERLREALRDARTVLAAIPAHRLTVAGIDAALHPDQEETP